MSYPSKPTRNNIIPENTIFASSNSSKIVMTSNEILNGYNNDEETPTPLTSCPDANRFNNFLYQVHNTLVWLIKYAEELYSDKFSKTGGTITGNIIMDSGAKLSGIVTPTQPTDAVPKNYLDSVLASAMWLGEIKVMAYPNIPVLSEGIEIVPCDGRAISRSTYSSLFSLIGTQFGSGDGSTTFNIPDYRGLFLRGWDGGSGRDSGRTYGSIQNSGVPTHTHTFSGNTGYMSDHASHSHGYTRAYIDSSYPVVGGQPGVPGIRSYNNQTTSSVNTDHTHSFSGTTSSPSSNVYQNINEVRPVNSTCYYLIRIK